jgi:hypothetical protein
VTAAVPRFAMVHDVGATKGSGDPRAGGSHEADHSQRIRALAALALAGCWPVPGQNADRTGHNAFESGLTPATVGEVTQAWASGTGSGAASDPVVSRVGVHVVVDGCSIRTHHPATGETVWSQSRPFPLLGLGCDPIVQFSPPFVVGERVIWGQRHEVRSPLPRCGSSEGMTSFSGDTFQHDVATGATPSDPGPPEAIIAAVRDDTAVATSARVFYSNLEIPQCPTAWFSNGIITVGSLSDPTARRARSTPAEERCPRWEWTRCTRPGAARSPPRRAIPRSGRGRAGLLGDRVPARVRHGHQGR